MNIEINEEQAAELFSLIIMDEIKFFQESLDDISLLDFLSEDHTIQDDLVTDMQILTHLKALALHYLTKEQQACLCI